ncbi:MAG: alpha/beta fold hydrolase [Pseudobdellovibrionaceae bacterium]
MLGHKLIGQGRETVIVMHDWFSDISSYDSLIPYLDVEAFRYIFVDLRGYGKSINIKGNYTVEEASQDVLELIETLKIDSFHLIGHSMSGMIAQYIASEVPEKVHSIIAITPVPASGSPVPQEVFEFMTTAARDHDPSAEQIVGMMTGNRQAKPFIRFKVLAWRKTATPEARVGYARMFAYTNFVNKVKGLKVPLLVLCGEYDAEGFHETLLKKAFQELYPRLTIEKIPNSGHYPMQEAPVLLSSKIYQFLTLNKSRPNPA